MSKDLDRAIEVVEKAFADDISVFAGSSARANRQLAIYLDGLRDRVIRGLSALKALKDTPT